LKLGMLILLLGSAVTSVGSTVSVLSTTIGTAYTVTVTDFTTTGADMVGMEITASYSTGGSLTCTWLGTGSCTSGVGGFSVTYPVGSSTHPRTNNDNWTITNSRVGFTMTSLTVNGIAGLTAFDRCMTSAGVFNDTNPGGSTGTSCNTAGTVGSDLGFSVGSGTAGTGSAGTSGTVVYQNALHLAGSPIVGDWWGQFTITFAGTAFTSGRTFTFRTDSDTLTSAIADVPEPGTFAGVGIALMALGLVARKRLSLRESSQRDK